ncbi:MAG: hypothetical protein DRJ38_08240 [Thermoprotei archaeon]|nr:MAG: hypothetical protein DRJ38_08240 [Thermoprotei archaeon]
MGRKLKIVLKTGINLKDAFLLSKKFFLKRGYRLSKEKTNKLLILEGGSKFWTLMATYRWEKALKTAVIRFKSRYGQVEIILEYDVSSLSGIFFPERSARKEIDQFKNMLNAELIEVKRIRE